MQMTSYLHHNFISKRETFPENLVKIRLDDVMLGHMTSFSYIFLYTPILWRHQQKCLQKPKKILIGLQFILIFSKRDPINPTLHGGGPNRPPLVEIFK